jgi:hypothetical protein
MKEVVQLCLHFHVVSSLSATPISIYVKLGLLKYPAVQFSLSIANSAVILFVSVSSYAKSIPNQTVIY